MVNYFFTFDDNSLEPEVIHFPSFSITLPRLPLHESISMRCSPNCLWLDYPANFNLHRPSEMPRELFRISEGEWIFPILFSGDLKPLENWGKQVRRGNIRRVPDFEFRDEAALEITGPIGNSFITCPENPNQSLGIMLPVMVLHVKTVNKPFEFAISIRDDMNIRRRILFGTHVNTFRWTPYKWDVQVSLLSCWNEFRMDLGKVVKKLFGRRFKEIVRLEIYSHCRLRLIYFTTEVDGLAAGRLAKCASAIGIGMETDHRGHRCSRPWLHMPRYPEMDPALQAHAGGNAHRCRSCSYLEQGKREGGNNSDVKSQPSESPISSSIID